MSIVTAMRKTGTKTGTFFYGILRTLFIQRRPGAPGPPIPRLLAILFFLGFFFFNPTDRPTQYHEETHSTLNEKKGRWPYTNWDSFTPRKYKINLIRTFTYRCYQERISCCYQIFSSSSLLQSALNDLRKLPLQNGYPQGIMNFPSNDLLERNRNKQSRWPCTIPMVPKKDVIILLLYLGHYPVMTTLC